MLIRGSYRQVLPVCRQVRGLLLWPVWRSFQALAIEFFMRAKHMKRNNCTLGCLVVMKWTRPCADQLQ